ncbi:hypothetical protein [Actinokineospora inagensis]|uniref:hypothetical protein n=1 Tax=Actinokineospora inagensis TaxID=103730 RepID=UPI000421A461|nr:hypothetical protein [Actinokineospora inagensis]
MLTRAAPLVAVVLIAACATAVSPPFAPAFKDPVWTRLTPRNAPEFISGSEFAGWDGGFLAAYSDYTHPVQVHTSPDGVVWRDTSPFAVRVDPRAVAGYGSSAYLLGWHGGELVVNRTQDGATWTPTPLPLDKIPTEVLDTESLHATIVTGEHGVLVVGWANDLDEPNSDLYLWYSPDGKIFPQPDIRPTTAVGWTHIVNAAATPVGFLVVDSDLATTVLLASPDGHRWEDISVGFPQDAPGYLFHLGANSSTTVVERRPVEDTTRPDNGHHIWYRRAGTWHPTDLAPGHLPDPGVVPVQDRNLTALRNWGSGFIGAGGTTDGLVGAVWTSPDGSTWPKVPVRANGFDQTIVIADVVTGNRRALAFGVPDKVGAGSFIWQTDPPR